MIIVGELINASSKSIAAAIENGDTAAIQQTAGDQAQAGADYIDVNAGIFVSRESDYLKCLTTTVQAAVDRPCALDGPDSKALMAAIEVYWGTPRKELQQLCSLNRSLSGCPSIGLHFQK